MLLDIALKLFKTHLMLHLDKRYMYIFDYVKAFKKRSVRSHLTLKIMNVFSWDKGKMSE